ncbi:MAG: hypothetical protein ACRD3O_15900 [Terriglobia bacterium]
MDPGSVSYSTTNAQSQWKAGKFGMGFEGPGLDQDLSGAVQADMTVGDPLKGNATGFPGLGIDGWFSFSVTFCSSRFGGMAVAGVPRRWRPAPRSGRGALRLPGGYRQGGRLVFPLFRLGCWPW